MRAHRLFTLMLFVGVGTFAATYYNFSTDGASSVSHGTVPANLQNNPANNGFQDNGFQGNGSPDTGSSNNASPNSSNLTNVSQVSIAPNAQTSGNWAGYVTTPSPGASPYTSVSGSWTVPSISGQRSSAAAQWIGLGGVSSHDLLQVGTIEEFQQGQPTANVFWERLPSYAHNVMTVPIGSSVSADIAQEAGTTWDVRFTIHEPSGQTQTKTVPVQLNSAYAQGVGTSAEWISEDPSNGNNRLYPLANMGTVSYTSTLVDGQPLNSSGNEVQPLALVSRFGVAMAPSALGSNGESFATLMTSTTTQVPGSGVQGYAGGGSSWPDHRRWRHRHSWGEGQGNAFMNF